MKRIEIEFDSCTYCPQRNGAWCVHPKIDGKIVPKDRIIPDWCPLPDVEEKKENPLLKLISTKNYGDDGIWLSKEELDKCLW